MSFHDSRCKRREKAIILSISFGRRKTDESQQDGRRARGPNTTRTRTRLAHDGSRPHCSRHNMRYGGAQAGTCPGRRGAASLVRILRVPLSPWFCPGAPGLLSVLPSPRLLDFRPQRAWGKTLTNLKPRAPCRCCVSSTLPLLCLMGGTASTDASS